MRSFSGASIRRVIDRSGVQVPEHTHDWPVLSLFVMGSYFNETEIGERFISGPSAVFYRACAPHRNTSGRLGFEQIEIEFDPAWVGRRLPGVPAVRWNGGRTGADVRHLVRACEEDSSEARLRLALQQFLESAPVQSQRAPAEWLLRIRQRLEQDNAAKVSRLAGEVGRHPSWTGAAYREAMGESMQQTAARLRVERATCFLRETDLPYASIALDAGFCDQSHMNRTFRRMLGRSPSAVRQDGQGFRRSERFPDRATSCI